MVRVDHVVDARNQLCPMPVIWTQQQVAKSTVGQILEIVCTDPGAMVDIPAWCRIHGHKILSNHSRGNEIIIRMQICADSDQP